VWISRYWISLPAFLFLLGVIAGSTPLIGIAVFLFLAGGLAQLWSKHVFDRVSYVRDMPENRAFAGETLSMILRLMNDKLLPVPWIEVRDPIPEGVLLDEKHTAQAPFPNYVLLSRSTHLSSYERVNWPLEFRALERGYYRLGPARLNSGDLFGLFPAERNDKQEDGVIIYPRVFTLPELGLPSERPFGERKGRQRIFEDPGRIAGIREYRPGDPMRRIDWKASARLQGLQSKVYEPSSTLHMLLAVNVHTLAHSWEGYVPEYLERILSVAASVATYGFDAGYAIGLTANGSYPSSDRPMRIPVGRRSEQLMRVLEALAVIGPLTLTPLETILDRESQAFPYGATLVCVTSRMDEPLAAALSRIAHAGHIVTVLSLAEGDIDTDLGNIRIFNLTGAMKSLEARVATNGAHS
jgi:uncharacterized protein (DUF58 family)